jgi:hypothetical protein
MRMDAAGSSKSVGTFIRTELHIAWRSAVEVRMKCLLNMSAGMSTLQRLCEATTTALRTLLAYYHHRKGEQKEL